MSFQRTCRKYHEGVRRSDSTCFHDVRRRSTSCGSNAGLARRVFATPGQVGMCVTAAKLQNAAHDLFRNEFPLVQIERSVGTMGVDDGVRGLHASLFEGHCTMRYDQLARTENSINVLQMCVLKRRRRGKGGRHDLGVTLPGWPRRTY